MHDGEDTGARPGRLVRGDADPQPCRATPWSLIANELTDDAPVGATIATAPRNRSPCRSRYIVARVRRP